MNASKRCLGTMARIRPIAAAVLLAGCTGLNWPYDLAENTPVRSMPRPDAYKVGGFGHVIIPVFQPASTDVAEALYLGVTAGPASPTAILRLSYDGEPGGGKLMHVYATNVLDDPWGPWITGTALGAASEWTYLDVTPDLGCVIVGEPGYEGAPGGFSRYCMLTTDVENPRRVEAVDMRMRDLTTPEAVGRSLTTLVDPGTSALRYIVLGSMEGAFLLNNTMSKALAPSLEAPTGMTVDDLGAAVAAGTLGTDWPALAASGGDCPVLLVGARGAPAAGGPGGPDPDDAWLQACWQGGTGFGTVLAASDVDGDGRDDLLVGALPDIDGRVTTVTLVDGAGFWDALPPVPYPDVTCTDIDSEGFTTFECSDVPERGVECGTTSGFGASMAAGDVDQDGSNEVAIGAPGAIVSGKNEAGAVYVFDPGDPAVPLGVLRHAIAEKNANLGASLAMPDIAGEDEIVAGSPGTDEVFLFWCSLIGTDVPPACSR